MDENGGGRATLSGMARSYDPAIKAVKVKERGVQKGIYSFASMVKSLNRLTRPTPKQPDSLCDLRGWHPQFLGLYNVKLVLLFLEQADSTQSVSFSFWKSERRLMDYSPDGVCDFSVPCWRV